MLGSGELGKEVVIEPQRMGVEVIAVDRYPNAPAMQVAHRSPVSQGGYADGTADVWTADGQLLARSRHLVTLFG